MPKLGGRAGPPASSTPKQSHAGGYMGGSRAHVVSHLGFGLGLGVVTRGSSEPGHTAESLAWRSRQLVTIEVQGIGLSFDEVMRLTRRADRLTDLQCVAAQGIGPDPRA